MKNSFLTILLAIVVAAVTGLAVGQKTASDNANTVETTFDRVTKSRTIKCGYFLWPVLLEKDLQTGRMKGVFYDYVESLGAALGFKIDWTGEMSFQSFADDMKTGKVDMVCGAIFAAVSAARSTAYFTKPFYYASIDAYTRPEVTKFDKDEEAINDPSVTIGVMDGEMTEILAKQKYPKAKLHTLPSTASIGQVYLDVANGRADVTLKDAISASQFMQTNPGKLRKVVLGQPAATFGAVMLLPMGDDRMLNMINGATDDLLNSGEINRILARYDLLESKKALPVIKPFQQ